MSGSSRAIVTNSPLKAHRHPPAHPSKTHTFTLSLSATSAVGWGSLMSHARSLPHHPTPSCRVTFPLEPPSLPPPTYSTVCGERAAIPDDTLNIRFPIMLLRAPSRFLHHAATSKKQHVAQRNTWQSHSMRVNTQPDKLGSQWGFDFIPDETQTSNGVWSGSLKLETDTGSHGALQQWSCLKQTPQSTNPSTPLHPYPMWNHLIHLLLPSPVNQRWGRGVGDHNVDGYGG